MQIFDRFPSAADAAAASIEVEQVFNLRAIVCHSQDEAKAIHYSPCELIPPILVVEKSGCEEKNIDVTLTVAMFGGGIVK